MDQNKKVVKINDIVANQIPEFILSENPNFSEFLKQYYISQEFQSSSIDLAENLIEYKNVDTFDNTNLITNTTLTSAVEFFDDVINVDSTNGWPKEYGLLKIDDEIITYTGITTNSFTGCIRGFSGIESLSTDNNPEFLKFSQTDANEHLSTSIVYNLSNLFLQEFFRKIKYQFSPGFEDAIFDPQINPQNFISKVKTFYQSKGTDEAYKILFKVLYGENVEVIKPGNLTFTSSDDKWVVCETFACELISGNPTKIDGQTLYQDASTDGSILSANGSIYSVDRFYLDNKIYYKLNLFSGYSNNLSSKGSISGTFVETPKTYVVETINANESTITVNSTIGFPNTGTLIINGITVTYTDKTNNQFLNCLGLTQNILPKYEVYGSNYVYAYDTELNQQVTLRILPLLSGLKESNALYATEKDPIQVENLGSLSDNGFTKTLIYNHPLTVYCGKVKQTLNSADVEGLGLSNGICRTLYNHKLKTGDSISLYNYNTDELIVGNSNITVNVLSKKEFSLSVSGIGTDSIGKKIVAKRVLKKSLSIQYPEINNKFTSNIQDSYEDDNYNYITSNGFPNFSNITPYKREFTFTGIGITLNGLHNFNDGELVTLIDAYNVGFSTGESFYVKVVDTDTINLAYSAESAHLGSFVTLPVGISTLIDFNLYNNNFTSSKSFKKIPKILTVPTEEQVSPPGNIGILVNGVELQNYKSFDKIYYGKINKINVLNGGIDYDITNPPRYEVDFGSDTETVLVSNMTGTLTELIVTDSGYNYKTTPTVTLSGGGTDGTVKTDVKMKLKSKIIEFNAGSTANPTIVNTINERFDIVHGFVTGDAVIYQSFNQTPIPIGLVDADGSLINNGTYYIINLNNGNSFALASTKNDALLGNSINLRSTGTGIQRFVGVDKKLVIDKVNIVGGNLEFKYKKLFTYEEGVNYFDNIFIIQNHGLIENDEVFYSFTGTGLNNLSTTTKYYVKKLDNNKFKLKTSKTSTSTVNFGASDSTSIHYFEYSPITVNISGALEKDISNNFIGTPATIKPIVLGKVDTVNVVKSKSGYGSDSIINFNYSPKVSELVGSGASIQALIFNGEINSVLVKTKGTNYFNSIKLQVVGTGYGAVLEPNIVNGEIVSVNIVNPGVGYDNTTRINIISVGKDLKVSSELQSWTLNEIDKLALSNTINGVLLGKNYNLFGNIFGIFHLTNSNFFTEFGIPSVTTTNPPTVHSKIIGWAYDGCPIYGPDGYKNSDGTGGIKRLTSSYNLKQNKETPNTYSFIEDYEYINGLGDLDEHNGRYCITPEYPNGVYAYFCTMTNNRIPVFPYIIGDTYKFVIESDNFNLKINQSINFNNLDIVKHTLPYGVENKDNYYDYVKFNANSSVNDGIVVNTSLGSVDDILVLNGGKSYSILDAINFDNTNTDGFGAFAEVSELSGVGVNSITSVINQISNLTFTYDNNKVIGISTLPHNLINDTYVNISSISDANFVEIEGFRKINTLSFTTNLAESLGSQSITGTFTSIKVKSSIFNFDIDFKIQIEDEILTVVGLDYENNAVNVQRELSAPAHAANVTVTLLSNKIYFDYPKILNLNESNDSYYFLPSSSVSIGTDRSVGMGNTLTIYPLGYGVSVTKFISPGEILLPNNKFNTGDSIVYHPGQNPIIVNGGASLNTLANLYVIKTGENTIGLVTERSQLKSTDNLILFSTSQTLDTSGLHKFTTNRDIVTGNVLFNQVTVNTTENHNLSVNDEVYLNVTSGITTTLTVTYGSGSAKLSINGLINPKIDLYKNDTVIFDLSSSTLSNTVFKLYTDKNFVNEYLGNQENGLEVIKADTSLTLKISEYTPRILYYNIESTIKKVYIDETVDRFNTILTNESYYSNKHLNVVSTTDTSFTLNYPNVCERPQYTSTLSTLLYNVTSSNYSGPIAKINILSKGCEYKKLPLIKSISGNGSDANLLPISNTIGKIIKSKIINNEFVLPSDKTLNPFSNLYSTIFVYDNYKVGSLQIISGGANYLQAPTVNLYSKASKQIIQDFVTSVVMKDGSINTIDLIDGSSGLKSTDTKLVFTNNTNGVQILGASYNSLDKKVTLTLKTPPLGFTLSNKLPFTAGDTIFIENVTPSGYNSSSYDYEFFVIDSVNPAYGSVDGASITYISPSDPGFFALDLSPNAIVVNSKYIPQINVTLKKNNFYSKESILNHNSIVINNDKNDPISDIVKVNTPDTIIVGDSIIGASSNAKGKVSKIETYFAKFFKDSSVSQEFGWKQDRGKLSNVVQKLPDNDYYQNFSYSLKSTEQLSNWDSIVSDLSHVSGYKKFSDLMVESVPEIQLSGITTTPGSSSSLNISLESYVDINTKNTYDLVTENVEDYNLVSSDKITFNSRIISDYLLSKNNRVLSVDNISNLFNLDNAPVVSILVDQILSKLTAKYIFFIQSSETFLGSYLNPMFFEMYLTRNGNTINLTSYAYDDPKGLGKITADIDPTNNEIILVNFAPTNPYVRISVRAIKEDANLNVGITTNSYGYNKNINITTTYAAELTPTQKTIYSIPLSETNSGTLFVGISSSANSIEKYYETSFLYNSGDLQTNIYSENILSGIGTIGISTSGSNLIITYDGEPNVPVTVYGNFNFIVNSSTSPQQQIDGFSRLNSNSISIVGATSGNPELVSTIDSGYSASKYIIQVEKIVGVTSEKSLIGIDMVNYFGSDYMKNIQYGVLGNISDLNFSVQYDVFSDTYQVFYTPTENADYNITFFEKNISSIL
jgi:hypothetical protein